ncbi:MAG: urea carboxylase [Fibrobacter sp.]|nr:urea carboxylase [Fibrobacter sp.]
MFKKVLIANRGEIACRVIRSLKEMGVQSVAVYSDADESAAHVLMADEAVRIGPAMAKESYLNVDAILSAIKQTGAEAVHPGYGFLSENAEFAKTLEENGVAFIGPTPKQLVEFGLKHRSKELAEEFGVPLVPGTGLLENVDAAAEGAAKIGYPVMLKSTAGGGGIGMSICKSEQELRESYDRIKRLSENNFKNAGLFVEKYVERGRHVEVQIFGDGEGNAVVLGERDCSVQRRNQKVIEETPAPCLPEETRKALHASALRLVQGVKYRSAGTVEFIYDAKDDKFYFLEVNTRLQVEHGVTETVFGVDLVRWMIEQAAGIRPFEIGATFTPKGHAMEFRVYAEDPGKNYRPSSGLLTEVSFPEGIRVDTWVSRGTEVSAFYDPLLAKVIVAGEDREDNICKAKKVLSEVKLCGFETNIKLLQDVLEMEDFVSGKVSTWILNDYKYQNSTFEILAPGLQTTVQDYPGRENLWDVGIPPSGPMDNYSFRLANKIVGNAESAAGIEMTLSGCSICFHTKTIIAWTGGEFPAKLNGKPCPKNQPVKIEDGDVLKFGITKLGQRAYLAVRGGIDVPDYLGSKSTFTLGGFGGHGGRALSAGDILHIGSAVVAEPLTPVAEALPELTTQWEIGVMYGPHGAPDYLTKEDVDAFFAANWEVHYNSSRTGIRLIGPQPKWARPDGGEAGLHPSNLHDNAYAVGTVDFTGDMPIILGVDGPSLGGFACPVTIVSSELWKIGQLKSGDRVKFIPLTATAAEEIRLAREANLENPAEAPAKIPALVAAKVETPIIAEFHKESEMEHIVVRADGDDYVLLEFGPAIIDLRLRFTAHAWMLAVKEKLKDVVIDVTPGIRSIQIHYNIRKIRQAEMLQELASLAEHLKKNKVTKVPTRTVYLPLSWDDPQTRLAIQKYVSTVRPGAPWCCPNNIEFIRRVNGLDSIDDVKRIVFDADYLVMGLGDVYLGAPVATPLDPRHRLVTTKYNPARTWTPENAVGIGGAYMCVYGMEGPGGYQFVGRTVQMWNRFKKTSDFTLPYLLRFFDQIRYYEVGADELLQMRKDFIAGKFHVKIEESSFDITEYEKFLAENAESITAFENKRKQAFEEEKERWIATGQFTFESHSAEAAPVADVTLAEGEEGVYSPVAGSLWKLVATTVGEKVKAGDTLAILESMKTEIPVVADEDAEVTQIFAKASMEVRSGQCLFALKTLH